MRPIQRDDNAFACACGCDEAEDASRIGNAARARPAAIDIKIGDYVRWFISRTKQLQRLGLVRVRSDRHPGRLKVRVSAIQPRRWLPVPVLSNQRPGKAAGSEGHCGLRESHSSIHFPLNI